MDEEELKQSTTTPLTFEFTKRKRWAETVINELVDVAILVFSQTGLILHCDASIHEVMGPGYSEDQIVNKNFRDLLHGEQPPSQDLRSGPDPPFLQATTLNYFSTLLMTLSYLTKSSLPTCVSGVATLDWETRNRDW